MKSSCMCLALAVLLPALTNGASLRTKMPAAKVEHLLVDIDESVHKAGDDADLVFTSLYTYDQQLERSLRSEVVALNLTLANLIDMHSKYRDEIGVYQVDLQQLNEKATGSNQMASKLKARSTEATQKFQRIANSVRMLVDVLQGAAITPQGKLATLEEPDARGEPARIYGAIRQMLATNKQMRSKFKDVFEAFVPESLIEKQASSAKQAKQAVMPVVRMTPELLGRTVAALKDIDTRMNHAKAKALLQLESKQHRFEGDAITAGAKENAQEGIEAEKERKDEEITFSINFTKAVLNLDVNFHKTVQFHIKEKDDLVNSIRNHRANQRKTLRDLIDLLAGKYIVSGASADKQPLSFLETNSKTSHQPMKMSGLQMQIEDTLKHKGDTHAILLKIKAMLERSVPVDAENVKTVMKDMGDVLRAVESEQTKADEAKRRCESQLFHADQEENQLRANMLLMSTARNRTLAAAKAAKSNLEGIVKKTSALQASPGEYMKFVAQAIKTLEGQTKDRKTIVVAIQKAEDVVGRTLADAPPVLALMRELQEQLSLQSEKEQTYQKEEKSFEAAFLQYVQDYLQLLKERKSHYQTSLSALELYSDELANDEVSQSDALGLSHDLDKESSDLCNSIMHFYEARKQRRTELTGALRNVLPQVPEILSTIMSSETADTDLD